VNNPHPLIHFNTLQTTTSSTSFNNHQQTHLTIPIQLHLIHRPTVINITTSLFNRAHHPSAYIRLHPTTSPTVNSSTTNIHLQPACCHNCSPSTFYPSLPFSNKLPILLPEQNTTSAPQQPLSKTTYKLAAPAFFFKLYQINPLRRNSTTHKPKVNL
jgi:hypothetical protein